MIVLFIACSHGPWQEATTQDDCCFALLFCLVVAVTACTSWLLSFSCVCSCEHRLIIVSPQLIVGFLFFPLIEMCYPTHRLIFLFLLADTTGYKGWLFFWLLRLANCHFCCCLCFCFFSLCALESPALVDWLSLLFSCWCCSAGWLLFMFCWFPIGIVLVYCWCEVAGWLSFLLFLFCCFDAQVKFCCCFDGTGWYVVFVCQLFMYRLGWIIVLFFMFATGITGWLFFLPLENFE